MYRGVDYTKNGRGTYSFLVSSDILLPFLTTSCCNEERHDTVLN